MARAGAGGFDLCDQGRGEAALAWPARLRHDRVYSDQSFIPGEFYSNAATFGLEPTQDSFALIRDALRGARSIFRAGKRYWKAGVMLNDLQDASTAPVQMFPTRDPIKSAKLMGVIDGLNGRFGRGMVRPAVSGIERRWKAKAEFLSPRYTTRLDELPEVTA